MYIDIKWAKNSEDNLEQLDKWRSYTVKYQTYYKTIVIKTVVMHGGGHQTVKQARVHVW